MANSVFQHKRTSISGRAANSTTLPNPGQIAINMADGIMYSTNGTFVFEIGANNTNVRVTGNAILNGVIANGSLGSASQVLTSNGTTVFWSTPVAGSGSVNTAAQYAWTNTHTFSTNVAIGNSALTSALTVYNQFDAAVAGEYPAIITYGGYGGGIGFTDTANTSGVYPQNSGTLLNFFVGQAASDSAASKVKATLDANGLFVVNTKAQIGNVAGAWDFGTSSVLQAEQNSNGYVEITLMNSNSGSEASSDFTLTDNQGNSTQGFVDLGINNSGYSNSNFTIVGARGGYLYSQNSTMVVGTADPSSSVVLFAGSTLANSAKFSANATVTLLTNSTANVIAVYANGLTNATTLVVGSLEALYANATQLTLGTGYRFSANGTEGTAGQILMSNGTSTFWNATANDSTNLGGVTSANYLRKDATGTVTIGYTVTPYNGGVVSAAGSYTVNPANGNYQYYNANGAHTLTAPSSDCAVDLLITNGTSAGAITFSGFTVGASTGSTYATTSGQRFVISVRRINAISTYSIYALQ